MDKRIEKFLNKHHVCTIASSQEGQPWCASVFYVYLEEDAAMVFTSDPATRHITEVMCNQKVAGAIAVETEAVGLIRGVQFSGVVLAPSDSKINKKLRRAYLKRFPYAILNSSPLWLLKLHEVKFTDNRLGFGTKIKWRKLPQ